MRWLISSVILLLTSASSAVADITVEEMQSRMSARICPAELSTVRRLDFTPCNGMSPWDANECDKNIQRQNNVIDAYNAFIRKCESIGKSAAPHASGQTPTKASPASDAERLLGDLREDTEKAGHKAEGAQAVIDQGRAEIDREVTQSQADVAEAERREAEQRAELERRRIEDQNRRAEIARQIAIDNWNNYQAQRAAAAYQQWMQYNNYLAQMRNAYVQQRNMNTWRAPMAAPRTVIPAAPVYRNGPIGTSSCNFAGCASK